MKRGNRVVVVSHCILNQNSVVSPLARAKGAFHIIRPILDKGIGIIQLPCPEFRFLGLTRKPMTKEEYDCPEYRILCRSLAEPVVKDLIEYEANDYEIVGLIGINHSPTCGITGGRGIFMEEFIKILISHDINLKRFEIPACNLDDKWDELKEELVHTFNI
ncbi:CD3072 family TudS-related putative desulfidase [Clostridium sp.]|uniref:CD3072 family TudS-related putative desulfidase n=1 Tax=Clostridium sp. TaxID=1506 RepID=UPI0034639598